MYLKVSVEGLVFGVDRLGCEVLGLDINAKVQCACMLNAISWCHIQAGYTSVQLALEQKHEATVEVLLEAIVAAGMDIDARYESRRERGQTLLMRASALGLTSTAAKLLALGADIAAKDAGGMTVLALACVKVGNMEKLSWGGASADEAPPGLAVGRWVRATVAKEVSKGSLGKVAEVVKGYWRYMSLLLELDVFTTGVRCIHTLHFTR